jgi:predicted lactoylglutathione lyase
MGMKLKVVALPVSDVDRSAGFCKALGWRPDWYAQCMVNESAGQDVEA